MTTKTKQELQNDEFNHLITTVIESFWITGHEGEDEYYSPDLNISVSDRTLKLLKSLVNLKFVAQELIIRMGQDDD